MTESAAGTAERQHGAVSPPPQNVGEGFKRAKHEMTEADQAPPGLLPGFRFFMERFGHMMSRLILTLLYVVLIAPVGAIYRFVTDPLMTRYPSNKSSFTPWRSKNSTLDSARRQG